MSATTDLATLVKAEAVERQGLREAELESRAQGTKAEAAREALIEAHATNDQAAVKRSEKALAQGNLAAESAAIREEAANRRLARAERERRAFETDHADELIANLEPQAIAAAEALTKAARDLLAADRAWADANQRISRFVAASPNGTPRQDMPIEHELARIVRDLRQTGAAEVRAPVPHWAGRHHAATQERTNRLIKLRRVQHKTEADEAEIERLRSDTPEAA